MIKPLIWMFSTENIKEHFLYLIKLVAVSLLLSCVALILPVFLKDSGILISQIPVLLLALIPAIMSLTLSGYFWELTECVINRKTDITATNVYEKNKIKQLFTIELPELKFFKFLWRGIASIVATAIFLYPLILIFAFSVFGAKMHGDFDFSLITAYIGCYIFIGLLVPALLWNYAYRNSVFSMLNIPKAVHIIGTYPLQYICNVILLLLFLTIQYVINFFIGSIFGISSALFTSGANILTIISACLISLLSIYWIFVNAYLLGTIVPADEA